MFAPMSIRTFQSAPPVRGAISVSAETSMPAKFQSAPPVRGAIVPVQVSGFDEIVSIRTPREGGDDDTPISRASPYSFNPHPP